MQMFTSATHLNSRHIVDRFVQNALKVAIFGLFLGSFSLYAASQSQAGPARSSGVDKTGGTVKAASRIPDVAVIDQNGNARRFYTDLVQGKVVAINFIYTTCGAICPPLGATFGKLQKSLGEHFGREVFLISISVDPLTDTPERLHSWAAQFGGRPGWTLVTGDKVEITRLLKSLGSDTASPENHSPLVLVINDKTGEWKRVYGLGSTAALTHSIEEMVPVSAVSSPEKKEQR